MAFQPVTNAVGVKIRATLDDELIENTLGFYNGLIGWDAVALEDLADAVATAWTINMLPLLATTYQLREVEATYLGLASGPVAVHPSTGVGGNASPQLPNNCALCVSFRTGLVGRSFRGRNYVSGLCENQATANEFSLVTANAVIDAYEAIASAAGSIGPGTQHVVISRYTNGALRPAGTVAVISAYTVTDLVVDSQRRRLPGRGA